MASTRSLVADHRKNYERRISRVRVCGMFSPTEKQRVILVTSVNGNCLPGGFPRFGSGERVKLIGMSNCPSVPGFHRHARLKVTPVWSGSPSRNCSQEALPFVEAPAKAKFARSVEAQPGVHFPPFSAFCVVEAAIMAARNKDVRRERIVFGLHGQKLGFNIAYCLGESFERILEACRTHECSVEHIHR